MLSKLIKHEFKATAKLLLPLYLIVLAFTIMDSIVLNLHLFKGPFEFISGFITGFYVLSLFAAGIVTFVLIIYRFYKNLMTDEGYLMFTLPVKPSNLINSKLIVSAVWSIVSFIVIFASLFIVFAPSDLTAFWREFYKAINSFNTTFGAKGILIIIETILLFLICAFYSPLVVYASIALGQLLKGHKVIGAFAAYIVLSTIIQILMTISFAFLGFALGKHTDNLNSVPFIVLPAFIVFIGILSIVFYCITNFMFKKKLNLE